jgi:hypothetical protein
MLSFGHSLLFPSPACEFKKACVTLRSDFDFMVLLDIFLLFLFYGQSTAQSESPCDDLIKYYSGFEQLIGQTVQFDDPFGTIFKASICANSFSGCGTCDGGGNAGYCEIWEDQKKRDMNHNEEGYTSCVGVFEKAQPITVGSGEFNFI